MLININQAANITESTEEGENFTMSMEEAAKLLNCTRNSFSTAYASRFSKFKKGSRVFFIKAEIEAFKRKRDQFRSANVTKVLPKRKAL
ncbi:MAG: helix-turn-helix domain-containing protein [Saprospiraceae bacterium]|nr:helix-turn-helix domain-containing protein [Saprospiraceae bacterium]